jgi:hypothetical protein
MTPAKRTPEQIAAEIETTIAKLNALATELPIDHFVQFSVGDITATNNYPNGYVTATVHRMEL